MIENPASLEQEFQFGFVMAKTALISNVTLSSSTGNVIKSTADASQWAHCFLTHEPENSTSQPGNISRKMSHQNGDANGNNANGQHHANGHHANGHHANGHHANGQHANGAKEWVCELQPEFRWSITFFWLKAWQTVQVRRVRYFY